MATWFHKKYIVRQFLPGLFFFIVLGLCFPKITSAQVATPPPPIEQRWEAEFSNRLPASDEALLPQTPKSEYFPWSWVAFQSYRNGNWEIYVRRDDGAASTRLTDEGASDIQPRINRGANRIVFASNRDGDNEYEIFSMRLDGSDLIQLTFNRTNDVVPVWSPDGTKILFQAYRDGQSEIYVMNADGSGQTRLTYDPGYDGQPDWSPDGSRILFNSNRSGGYRIWVMNADGSSPTMLSNQSYSAHPKWSPNGSQIAYDADGDGNGWQELWLMNADGSQQRAIRTPYTEWDYWAGSWAPDGRHVAYTHIHYQYYQNNLYWTGASIGFVDIVDGGERPLESGALEWNPDWQTPDLKAPVSNMVALPAQSPWTFLVSWSGVDQGEAGIKEFEVQVKDGVNGTWTALLSQTTNTSISYVGVGGHSYYFRVRALDNSCNLEPWSDSYQTVTMVEALPPVSRISPLPDVSRDDLKVTWEATDLGGSGIKSYDVQYRKNLSTTWSDIFQPIKGSTEIYIGFSQFSIYVLPGDTVYLRVRATDNAQNVEPWPISDQDPRMTHVTFYSWQFSGTVHDNIGIPIREARLLLNPSPVLSVIADAGTNYIAYGIKGYPVYSTQWSRSGYGNIPPTEVKTEQDVKQEVILPPPDNGVVDGTFESGAITSGDWQASGALPTKVSESSAHTGKYSAVLNVPYWSDVEDVADFKPIKEMWNDVRIVVDSLGTVHMMWIVQLENSSLVSVFYANKPEGAEWSTPTNLSGEEIITTFDFVMDHLDMLHLVVGGKTRTWYANKPRNGNWGAPTVISDIDLYAPKIAAGVDGSLHVVCYDYRQGILYTTRPAGGQWAPFSLTPFKAYTSNLQIDREGTLHLLWTTYGNDIRYSSKPKAGDWTQEELLSGASRNRLFEERPEITIDDDGTLHGVWGYRDYDGGNNFSYMVEYRSKAPGVSWSSPVIFQSGREPHIVALHGKVTMVYGPPLFESSAPKHYYAEKLFGSNWTDPVELPFIRPVVFGGIGLAAGLDNALHISWVELNTRTYPSVELKVHHLKNNPPKQTGEAILSQSLAIPDGSSAATLAFFYQLGGASLSEHTGLSVQLQTPTGDVNLFSTQTNTSDWTFQSLNVSAWRGQTVTLVFRVNQLAGENKLPTWALIDDVSLGSTYPDLWVSPSSVIGTPGEEVTYTLACGNRGGVPANNVQIMAKLPPELTFVSAQPAPVSQSPLLTWNMGNLPAKSEGCSIRVTVRVDAAALSKKLVNQIEIRAEPPEIELENNFTEAIVIVPWHIYLPATRK